MLNVQLIWYDNFRIYYLNFLYELTINIFNYHFYKNCDVISPLKFEK